MPKLMNKPRLTWTQSNHLSCNAMLNWNEECEELSSGEWLGLIGLAILTKGVAL